MLISIISLSLGRIGIIRCIFMISSYINFLLMFTNLFRALDILASLFDSNIINEECLNYFQSKNILGALMKVLADNIDFEKNKFIDNPQLIYAGSMLVDLIQGTYKVTPIFLEEFCNCKGYDAFFTLLVLPPFDGQSSTTKDTLITLAEDLVFFGTDAIKPASNATPYQHSGNLIQRFFFAIILV
ncbi:hypothetical protein C1646_174604 [Rhizophagus diaphanus]|nr:hypothetical protein C1646_174604 [Rhizophagus diaphanus] [Rhizophagus sp. MUCL 43196]